MKGVPHGEFQRKIGEIEKEKKGKKKGSSGIRMTFVTVADTFT